MRYLTIGLTHLFLFCCEIKLEISNNFVFLMRNRMLVHFVLRRFRGNVGVLVGQTKHRKASVGKMYNPHSHPRWKTCVGIL